MHPHPRLLRVAPYFPVHDVASAVAHYETRFGFRKEYAAGDPPEFAIVSRDALSIMFRRVDEEQPIVPNQRQGGTWDAFFWVTNVESLHREMVERGAVIAYGPVVQTSYGMKEFAVLDDDGYVLGFGEQWME